MPETVHECFCSYHSVRGEICVQIRELEETIELEVKVPDGKLYIYGSFDDREDVYCSEKYHVVSSTDLKNWTIHEKALDGKEIPWFDDPDAPEYPKAKDI